MTSGPAWMLKYKIVFNPRFSGPPSGESGNRIASRGKDVHFAPVPTTVGVQKMSAVRQEIYTWPKRSKTGLPPI